MEEIKIQQNQEDSKDEVPKTPQKPTKSIIFLNNNNNNNNYSSSSSNSSPSNSEFDILEFYNRILSEDENLAVPIAAVQSLIESVSRSNATTMQELIAGLYESIDNLKRGTSNLISLTAGCDLFLRFLMTQQLQSNSIEFIDQKNSLVHQAKNFVIESRLRSVERVASYAIGFIEDGSTILIHGYSRVVLHAILKAHSPSTRPKKRFQVFVTESRPAGLGLKTHAILEQHGIPCVVLLDSAVAYAMAKVDLVLVGAEAVLEDGGLINYIGSYQMAIAAKAHNKPVYALAESYKFLRLFPLSQYDLPTPTPTLKFPCKSTLGKKPIIESELNLPGSISQRGGHNYLINNSNSSLKGKGNFLKKVSGLSNSSSGGGVGGNGYGKNLISIEEVSGNNPTLDYTTPDLISLVICDSGILTPPGVAEVLLSVFGGE